MGALVVTSTGDRVEVRDGGSVLAAFIPRTPAGKRGAATAREVTVEGRRVLEVRLPLATGGRHEVWLGERDAHGARTLWTDVVGPADSDGETGRALAVTADGIERYQTAARLSRCDG